jgi:hypothetical protein
MTDEAFYPLAGLVGVVVAALLILIPIAALAIIAATLLTIGWTVFLDERFGDIVSPDQTIPVGIALIAGWLLIIAAAIVAVGLVVS